MIDTTTVVGMVLSSMPIGEFDKRVVIFTKEMGKISAFARGARKPNSPFLASTQPMAFGEFTLYQGRNSFTINSAKISDYFFNDMHDVDTLYTGMYFLELADYYGKENLDGTEVLTLLYMTMKTLAKGQLDIDIIRSVFDLRILVENGEYPNVFTCKNCGKKDNIDYFDMKHDGVLCSDCHGTLKEQDKLLQSTLYALQYIETAPMNKLFAFDLKDNVKNQLKQITNDYIAQKVDKHFNSLDFI